MENIVIDGGRKLSGTVTVGGFKNAALPIIFATIIAEDVCVIENIPDILDVTISLDILKKMGADVRMLDKNTVRIDTTGITPCSSDNELASCLRGSYYVLGAELARFGKSKSALPGGCDIGVRPIDQHIKGFKALGAEVITADGCVYCSSKGLTGSNIYLDIESVGATANLILAAAKAEGMTVIDNAAKEPHIVDLANFLNSCGADITGAGTGTIKIRGVKKLHGVTYAIIPDMIEAGGYMIAAAATHSVVTVDNVIPKHMESLTAKLIEMGIKVTEGDESITVDATDEFNSVNVKTLPYPGFPTDLNATMGVLLAVAKGTGIITEGVFENRFRYVPELVRMGAEITVDGRKAVISGVPKLKGTTVKATDLRSGAAMVIAGLCAEGTTVVNEIQHIERGYEHMVEKLTALGASICKTNGNK